MVAIINDDKEVAEARGEVSMSSEGSFSLGSSATAKLSAATGRAGFGGGSAPSLVFVRAGLGGATLFGDLGVAAGRGRTEVASADGSPFSPGGDGISEEPPKDLRAGELSLFLDTITAIGLSDECSVCCAGSEGEAEVVIVGRLIDVGVEVGVEIGFGVGVVEAAADVGVGDDATGIGAGVVVAGVVILEETMGGVDAFEFECSPLSLRETVLIESIGRSIKSAFPAICWFLM